MADYINIIDCKNTIFYSISPINEALKKTSKRFFSYMENISYICIPNNKQAYINNKHAI